MINQTLTNIRRVLKYNKYTNMTLLRLSIMPMKIPFRAIKNMSITNISRQLGAKD